MPTVMEGVFSLSNAWFEGNLRRALLISHGDAIVSVSRPLSTDLLGIAVLPLLMMGAPSIRAKCE